MRVLDGPVTDAMEASALTFNNQYIDVYSCCWGPPDDGDNFKKPHPLTAEALETGVKEVRIITQTHPYKIFKLVRT